MSQNQAPLTVLVVEDSPTELAMLADVLRAAGYVVATAASGTEARELLARRQVSAIVMDLILPDMNGYDLYRAIRNNEHTSVVPIIMLTQRVTLPEEYYGRMLGAEAYLKKPLQPQALLDELQRLIPRG
jgi:chemotaxis family two-component system response regulator PixH